MEADAEELGRSKKASRALASGSCAANGACESDAEEMPQPKKARRHLPPGPCTASEAFEWPTVLWGCLHEIAEKRVVKKLQGGIEISSDYSGVGAIEEGLRQLLLAVRSTHGESLKVENKRASWTGGLQIPYHIQRDCWKDAGCVPQEFLQSLAYQGLGYSEKKEKRKEKLVLVRWRCSALERPNGTRLASSCCRCRWVRPILRASSQTSQKGHRSSLRRSGRKVSKNGYADLPEMANQLQQLSWMRRSCKDENLRDLDRIAIPDMSLVSRSPERNMSRQVDADV